MEETSNIDTLIIVGNGFDLWQDLPISYIEYNRNELIHRLPEL